MSGVLNQVTPALKEGPVVPPGVFPLVGLGASSGGVTALQQFFANVPEDSGMAFVVILHLAPTCESHLVEVLQSSTPVPVTQATERVAIRPNKVYVIPPGKQLSVSDGHLVLSDAAHPLAHAEIDLFFRTLGDVWGPRAACVVLSGAGADGSVGLKHVKECGGITFAQDPSEAEYDQMSRNAISTDLVDFVLPAAQIPAKLVELWRNANQSPSQKQAALTPVTKSQQEEAALIDILAIVQARTNHSFQHYRRATILQCIQNRMRVSGVATLSDYCDHLRRNAAESKSLLNELLFSVTGFFRDRAAFGALERDVVPRLFEGKRENDIVRVWVAGCATGEEAYSVEMLLLKHAGSLPAPPRIQIFASDANPQAIAKAREGFYPPSIELDVPPAYLRSFFVKEKTRYRISPTMHERILFATHDLLRDAPFSKLDLIVCRNLLCHFNRDLHEKIFNLFHFALRPGGFLFLGKEESPDGDPDLFRTIDEQHQIFCAERLTRPNHSLPPLPLYDAAAGSAQQREDQAPAPRPVNYKKLHQKFLERYMPPSVLVNSEGDIVHFSEHAGRFFRIAGGEPTLNLLKVARPEFRRELATAFYSLKRRGKSAESITCQIKRKGQPGYVNLILQAVQDAAAGDTLFLVLFQEVGQAGAAETDRRPAEEVAQRDQTDESEYLRKELGRTLEQYNTTVEELNASNEDLQATNMELRAIVEEYETSKEELQSSNEELITVNQELTIRVNEVISINDDLKNLMSSTDIATVFLDRGLRIKRYTSRAQDIFNFIPRDEGRPLKDIHHNLDYSDLLADAEEVLRSLHMIEREVTSMRQRVYLARMLPYRTVSDHIEGVVLTFVDITERKQAEDAVLRARDELEQKVHERTQELRQANADLQAQIAERNRAARALYESEGRFRALVAALAQTVWTTDAAGLMVEDSPSWRAFTGLGLEQLQGRGWLDAVHPEDRPHVWHEWQQAVNHRVPFKMEYRLQHVTGGWRHTQCRAVPLPNSDGSVRGWVGMNIDITERKEAAEERLRLLQRIVHSQEEERRRISRELHDHLGQQLTVLRLNVEALQSRGTGESNEHLAELRDAIRDLDADVDFLAWELRPSALDDFGLVSAIDNFVQEWSRHFEIPVEFHATGLESDRLPQEIENNLYRITQEALNNISKHAKANQVGVILERRDGHVVLVVEDDGIGFDLEQEKFPAPKDRGLGLIGMRERAALVGGTLEIESSPGLGATVFVRIPLQPEGAGTHE